MDPITIGLAFSAAQTAVSHIKQAIALGKDVNSLVGQFSKFFESSDAIHAVQISEDPSAFLVCIIESRGQGGWEVNWQGLCKSIDELTNINENFLSDIYDVDKISDELILKLWTN